MNKYSLKELVRVSFKLLSTIFNKRVILFVEPHHPNLGDLAQLICTREWIKKTYPDYKLIEAGQFFIPFDNHLESHFLNLDVLKLLLLQLLIYKGDLLIGHSGYFFVDHHSGWLAYELIIRKFPNNRFVILPQTVNFFDPFVIERVKKSFSNSHNLTLLCRDEISFKKAQALFEGIHLLLFPDIVTSLIGTKSFHNRRDGILFCLRDDVEAFYSEEEINTLINRFTNIHIEKVDTTLKLPIKEVQRRTNFYIEDMIRKMSTFQVVVTDRYHGTIFSAIASTPVVVINSSDHKLSSGVNWFPKDIFGDMVQYANDLDDAYLKIKNMLSQGKNRKDNPPYFKEKYWDKLIDFIK